jgi:hypothetical protein
VRRQADERLYQTTLVFDLKYIVPVVKMSIDLLRFRAFTGVSFWEYSPVGLISEEQSN